VYLSTVPDLGITLVEIDDKEARELVAVLNSSDLLREAVYERVPIVKALVDSLYSAERWEDGRATLHEQYGLGHKTGGTIDFKTDEEEDDNE
jgi:hypothetical protein